MENRIDRTDDEYSYQPKIRSERLMALCSLKQAAGMPMTVLLDQAIRESTERSGAECHPEEELVMEEVEKESWEDIREYIGLLDRLDYVLSGVRKNKSHEQRGKTN